MALLLPLLLLGPPPPARPAPMPAPEAFAGHFHVSLPRKVRVLHYYGDVMPMDPSFAWELGPVDPVFLERCVKAGGLKRAAPGSRPNSHTYTWPRWWNKARIEKLPEVYFVDAPSALVRIWVEWVNL